MADLDPAELAVLRDLRRDLMATLPYDDEDVETSLVVAADALTVEMVDARAALARVQALADEWASGKSGGLVPIHLLREALRDPEQEPR